MFTVPCSQLVQEETFSDSLCAVVAPVKGALIVGLRSGGLVAMAMPRDATTHTEVVAHASHVVAVSAILIFNKQCYNLNTQFNIGSLN